MDFKDILKELRASKDITQEDLAKATGLKRSAIGMYESGKRRPDFETLEIFADYFNVDMNTLLGKGNIPSFILSAKEEEHIKKYRQLDAGGQDRIDRQIDFELLQPAHSAEAKEERLG